MTTKLPGSLIEAIRYFSDRDVCTEFVAKLRWPNGPVCENCGGAETSYISTRRLWKCKACKRQFSVKVGTIFEDSALGLDKWLPAVWLIANSKNGISSHELARSLGVTQKSAGSCSTESAWRCRRAASTGSTARSSWMRRSSAGRPATCTGPSANRWSRREREGDRVRCAAAQRRRAVHGPGDHDRRPRQRDPARRDRGPRRTGRDDLHRRTPGLQGPGERLRTTRPSTTRSSTCPVRSTRTASRTSGRC